VLDPRILTIGFARRFATYKRASLMITDRERLKQILFHPERPIQIVISGKSHPRDDGGKRIIQDLVRFINEGGARSRIVFLEDYDMQVARALVQGVDLWLNNPRRPHEASGTSGMKVVPNGGLNCSILDGWWDEAYESGLGWAIGDRTEVTDEGHQDWLDSRSLYHLLENEIAPVFYHRVENGVPRGWLSMVRKSIMNLGHEFSNNRMLRQYTQEYYIPSAQAYHHLSSGRLENAYKVLGWRDRILANWKSVRVAQVEDNSTISNPIGKAIHIRAFIELGALNPTDVRVEALVGKIGPNRELVQTKSTVLATSGKDGERYVYEGTVVCDAAGHQGYTVRVVPANEDIQVPSELNLISWE
jgi:starch phosphorylase